MRTCRVHAVENGDESLDACRALLLLALGNHLRVETGQHGHN